MTKTILTQIVHTLVSINYNVVAVVSDMGGGNVGLMRELGVGSDCPSFTLDGIREKIFYFPDAPHILKLIRNWFIDTGFIMDGQTIDIKPVEHLISMTRTEINVCHKISNDHLSCEGNQRQNVKLAAQLLSHNTAVALKHYYANDDNPTADFIEMVNNWFDLMNVRFPGNNITPFKAPYGMSNAVGAQNVLLNQVETFFKNVRCKGKCTMQLFQKGILMSILSLRQLHDLVSKKHHVSYILTAKLNQDSLENLFSQLRSRGGLNDHPTPLDALYRLRMIILGRNPGVVQKHANVQETGDDHFIVAKAATQIGVGSLKLKATQTYGKDNLNLEHSNICNVILVQM